MSCEILETFDFCCCCSYHLLYFSAASASNAPQANSLLGSIITASSNMSPPPPPSSSSLHFPATFLSFCAERSEAHFKQRLSREQRASKNRNS